MRLGNSILPRAALGFALGLFMTTGAVAKTALEDLSDTVEQVEDQLDARVGLAMTDTGSDFSWSHRADERFLMNSTMKVPLCGAVLAQVDAGKMSLSDELPVHQDDILSYAPVTKERVGQSMTLDELCYAALDMSDNTATNLLIRHLGGPEAVTQFLRRIGDSVTRSDRYESALNTWEPGDPRDTTKPVVMIDTLQKLLLGDALTTSSRDQLVAWMSHGGVTQALLRDDAPSSWKIADKSGSGDHNRNIVALITPDDGDPRIVTIYISDTDADFKARNAALKELGAAVIRMIKMDEH
ncbi:class A beta-lactamase [Marinobacter sp. R17]|uniref:class A beta-lactamase n=1 Tax=Marinobacter sp. R17 TaxID=2484250 RepID=UPI000F4CB108|nr:class A beta-lactamase [Marinobacter sp. R17]ROU00702.1 class A beta-lactamase [Marinobacter sp. R17]